MALEDELWDRLNTFTTCGCGDDDWPQLRHDLAAALSAPKSAEPGDGDALVERLLGPEYWVCADGEGAEKMDAAPVEAAATIASLKQRIAELEAENFTLAAGQCAVENGLIGDEHGHFACSLKQQLAERAPDESDDPWAGNAAREGMIYAPSAPDPEMATAVEVEREAMWLIWATEGEYSDRSEWPVALCADQATAEAATLRIGQLWRELHAIFKRRENELDEAGDYDGKTLSATTDEGRELHALTGASGGLSGYYADDRDYTCCKVRLLDSAAIRALTNTGPEQKGSGGGVGHDG